MYRYFEDHDSLVRAAIDRHLEQVRPLYLIHEIGVGPLDARIDRFVTARLGLYEAIASTARASRRRAPDNDIIGAQVEVTRRSLRAQVDKHFAPELQAMGPRRRRATAAAVDVLCQLESLDAYRLHRGASVREVHVLLVDALRLLLPTSPAPRKAPR